MGRQSYALKNGNTNGVQISTSKDSESLVNSRSLSSKYCLNSGGFYNYWNSGEQKFMIKQDSHRMKLSQSHC